MSIFKKRVRDELYFREMLKGLSSYEMMCLIKAMTSITSEMLEVNKLANRSMKNIKKTNGPEFS